MKYIPSLCAVLLINAYSSFAIDSLTLKYALRYPYWAFKLPFSSLADPYSPSLQLAVERRFDRRNAVQLQGGPSIDPSDNTLNGLRLKGEYRNYIRILREKTWLFVGAEIFYTRYNNKAERQFINSIDSSLYEDYYMLHKISYGLIPKFGIHRQLKDIVIDIYAGLGIKHRIVTQTGRARPGDKPSLPRHPNIYAASYREGDDWLPNPIINITFGYIH